MELVVVMDLERETKGAVRYAEQTNGGEAKIGTLYIRKSAVGKAAPQTIKVTVTEQPK